MVQYRQEIRRLIGLAFPILLAQVAQTAMTLVDTIMAGRYSAIDLAAISVASSFWLPIVLTSQGIIMALTPIVAQLNGAQKKAQIPHAVAQGLWLTALVFIPAGLLLYFSPLLLHWMDVSVLMAEKTTKSFISYALDDPKADYTAKNIEFGPDGTHFDVYHKEEKIGTAHLVVPGRHNVLNALGAAGSIIMAQPAVGIAIYSSIAASPLGASTAILSPLANPLSYMNLRRHAILSYSSP